MAAGLEAFFARPPKSFTQTVIVSGGKLIKNKTGHMALRMALKTSRPTIKRPKRDPRAENSDFFSESRLPWYCSVVSVLR